MPRPKKYKTPPLKEDGTEYAENSVRAMDYRSRQKKNFGFVRFDGTAHFEDKECLQKISYLARQVRKGEVTRDRFLKLARAEVNKMCQE